MCNKAIQDANNQTSDVSHEVVGKVIDTDGHTISFSVSDWVQDPIDLYASQAVVALGQDKFAVTWESVDSHFATTSIKSQIFSARDGHIKALGGMPLVLTDAASAGAPTNSMPASAALHGGGYVSVWTSSTDKWTNAAHLTGPDTIHFSVVSDAGAITTADTNITPNTGASDGSQLDHIRPSVAGLIDGNFVITWQDQITLADGSVQSAIKAGIFDANGNAVGDAFTVNASTPDGVSEPSIGALKDGGFVISWTDHSASANGVYDIMGQQFASDGARVGTEFIVNDNSAPGSGPANYTSSVTGLAHDNFVISWTSGNGYPNASSDDTVPAANIHSQVFHADQAVRSHAPAEPSLASGGTNSEYSSLQSGANGGPASNSPGLPSHHESRASYVSATDVFCDSPQESRANTTSFQSGSNGSSDSHAGISSSDFGSCSSGSFGSAVSDFVHSISSLFW